LFSIFKQAIKEKRWTLLTYCLAGLFFVWIYVSLFPIVQGSSVNVAQLVKNLPEGVVKAFSLDPKSFTMFEGFISGKHFSLLWPIMLIGLAISSGSAFISEEIEKKTISILLSEPISRTKIFLGKFLAGVFNIFIFTTVSILLIVPLAKIYGVAYTGEGFLKITIIGFVFGLSVFSLSMLFSAMFSEKGKVIFLTSGTLMAMYFANLVALLKDNLSGLKYFSFFYYFNYSEILVHNKIDNWAWLIFLGTFLISSSLAIVLFNKRDIAA